MEKFIDKPWDWGQYGLSQNPSITPDFLEKFIDKPWDWYYGLSCNPAITPEFIKRHIYYNWNWGGKTGLTGIPTITLEFIGSSIIKPQRCVKSGLSSNPSITPEFIKQHINKPWSWVNITLNDFDYQNRLKIYKRHQNKLIMKYANNWIDRPITRDGKPGISVRLAMRQIDNLY